MQFCSLFFFPLAQANAQVSVQIIDEVVVLQDKFKKTTEQGTYIYIDYNKISAFPPINPFIRDLLLQ